MLCLHINTNGVVLEKTQDGVKGWWLPLNKNLFSWRAMNLQEPMAKFMITFGVLSFDQDRKNNVLRAVFKGTQFFRTDVVNIGLENMKLFVTPPHNPELLERPPPREKPGWIDRAIIAGTKWFLERINKNNKRLPWAPREKICPAKDFDDTFEKFKEACPDISSPSVSCIIRFTEVYPCYSYLLRSSKIGSHGMTGLSEFMTIVHVAKEAPWDFMKTIAQEKPWDKEFEEAANVLGWKDTKQ